MSGPERQDEGTVANDQSGADAPKLDLDQGDELTIGQERVVELLSFVVINLVDHPEAVIIDIARQQDRDLYQVKVHPDDLGRVIGKGGQTARALRTLLLAVSARTDQRLGLEIVE